MEDLIQEYESLKSDYNRIIVNAFNSDDFADYTENLFTAHSCAIEGNSFSVNETKELKEKGLDLKIYNKSLFEAFEILEMERGQHIASLWGGLFTLERTAHAAAFAERSGTAGGRRSCAPVPRGCPGR